MSCRNLPFNAVSLEKGYDAIFIATTTGLETTAVDISQTALKEANECDSCFDIPNLILTPCEDY